MPESIEAKAAVVESNRKLPDEFLGSPKETLIWRWSRWARRIGLERKLVFLLVFASVVSGVSTFLITTGNALVEVDDRTLTALLILDMVFLLSLLVLVGRRLVYIWLERRKGLAGARIHARMVGLFGLVAALPAVVVAAFSAIVFEYGLRAWFSDQVSTAIRNSLEVAEAYMDEHSQTIAGDAVAMAQDMGRAGTALLYSPQRLQSFVKQQAAIRALSDATVIDSGGNIFARSDLVLGLSIPPTVPQRYLDRARASEVVVYSSESEGRVRAIVKLESFADAFLVIGRLIDPRVIGHMDRTRGAYQLYTELEGQRSGLQVTFAVVFLLVATLLLLCSFWVGMAFANRLSEPIRNLIGAAEKVSAGDLQARVVEGEDTDELAHLSRAFNRMTSQLGSQQNALLQANAELEHRKGFIEAVLAGVTAGIIGLDEMGRITLANRFATDFLGQSADELEGRPLSDVLPEAAELIQLSRKRLRRPAESQIQVIDTDGHARSLLIRVTAEFQKEGFLLGFVITFDDITELVSAQRKAAWADVARRIAHEIKNPLTPIQLSAERLKRRYLKEIKSDPHTFEVCIDTIRRHVSDIGEMVNEFTSFARMPQPVFKNEDLVSVLKEALVLQEQSNTGIIYEKDFPKAPVELHCDRKQIGRAFTNILQNGAEAIEGRGEDAPQGRIRIQVSLQGDQIEVLFSDNGKGLPPLEKHRLTEPYVTTREKGTGLGLAIVKKIMEDHQGHLGLEDIPEGGAMVRLVFTKEDRSGVTSQDEGN
ncbi:PAS domain-containing sensor histidine kinase [Limibacillus sp. MBR-115]|jgi:two-component system nitrogen regulation sensor histidine kinase NtrY|uniref:sensor histidine kinase NtrY-like n=1 Tax=Limibacillus sp. MBR-115 TaxID=3156465 RepID=UPI003390C5B9